VNFPDEYLFDSTSGRGMDRISLFVDVLVGKVSDRAARDDLAPYCDGSGIKSVKQVLETGDSPPVTFTGGSRSTFVSTLTGLPAGHGVHVGHTVTVDSTDNTFDGAHQVMAHTATTIKYVQALGNSATAGTGTITVVPSGAESYVAFDTVRVTGVEFGVITVADVEHLAASFTLDIAGTGA
jgi:hypothetical protein